MLPFTVLVPISMRVEHVAILLHHAAAECVDIVGAAMGHPPA